MLGIKTTYIPTYLYTAKFTYVHTYVLIEWQTAR
jgi:hypothetical protein